MKEKQIKTYDDDGFRTDIYYCSCCSSFRDLSHRKISSRYCMCCDKKSNMPTKQIHKDGVHTQICQECFDSLEFEEPEIKYFFRLSKLYCDWMKDTNEEPKNQYLSFSKYSKEVIGLKTFNILGNIVADSSKKLETLKKGTNKKVFLEKRDVIDIIRKVLSTNK